MKSFLRSPGLNHALPSEMGGLPILRSWRNQAEIKLFIFDGVLKGPLPAVGSFFTILQMEGDDGRDSFSPLGSGRYSEPYCPSLE